MPRKKKEALPAEEYLERVARAVRLAATRLAKEAGYVGSALAGAEVMPGIPDLEIGSVSVVLPGPPGQGRLWVSYTWSWIAAHSEEAIADELVAEVHRAATPASRAYQGRPDPM